MRLGVVYDVCYVSRRCSNARKNPCVLVECKQLQDTGVFFYRSIPQKTAVALGLDPQTTTCIYPLSINTRCENRIFAAPRTSSHGSGARGAALLLPLSKSSPCGSMGQREEGALGHPLPPPDAYRRPTALPRCARSGAAPALCCALLLAQGVE